MNYFASKVTGFFLKDSTFESQSFAPLEIEPEIFFFHLQSFPTAVVGVRWFEWLTEKSWVQSQLTLMIFSLLTTIPICLMPAHSENRIEPKQNSCLSSAA